MPLPIVLVKNLSNKMKYILFQEIPLLDRQEQRGIGMNTELQSLTQEEIKQRELAHQDLWIIKLGDEIKGPYELENLKLYAQENEASFQEALASRLEPQQWNPFFSYPQFQRRSPQVINATDQIEGPFWLYENGLKAGPFEKFHILKRLEMNSLIVTDKISLDEGKTWINIYEIPEFDRRDLTTQELPIAPPTQTLAQLYGRESDEEEDVVEEVEETTSEMIASTAHRGLYKNKVLKFRADNLSLPNKKPSFWRDLSLPDWALPSGVALGVMMIGGVIFSFVTPEETTPLSVTEITNQSRPLGEKRIANPSAQLGRQRAPASVKNIPTPRTPPAALRQIQTQDNIPTTIQTHHVDRYPSNDNSYDPDFGHYDEPYTDPYDNPFEENGMILHEAPPAASLVPEQSKRRDNVRRPTSVGDVMGYEENVIDEASDF